MTGKKAVNPENLSDFANPLARHSKTDFDTTLLVVRGFCYGVSVPLAAKQTGLTPKSIRATYLQLREHLLRSEFAPWHRANRVLVTITSKDIQEALRESLFDELSACHANKTCWRNFKTGHRKNRLCRPCPLKTQFTDELRLEEALHFSDTIRAFYAQIGIGHESKFTAIERFKRRAIHTATITAASQATRRGKTGVYDYTDPAPLAFKTLLQTMLGIILE